MKIQLDLGTLQLPEGYTQTTVVATGPVDGQPKMQAGPTLARTKPNLAVRSLTVSTTPYPDDVEVPEEALNNAIHDLHLMFQGRIDKVEACTVQGAPGKRAEISHTVDGKRKKVHMVVLAPKGAIWSIILSVLDTPKSAKPAASDMDDLLASISFSKD